MQLDYNPATKAFILRVPRGSQDIRALMVEHGFDMSLPASTPGEAVLFTHEPYAAVTFIEFATPAARAILAPIADIVAASWKSTSDRHFEVPCDRELWEFQKASLEYALDRTHSLVADEPGLGKTPIAITYANEIEADRVLVICPANIRLQWAQRIAEWSTRHTWRRAINVVTTGRHSPHQSFNWTIASYDLARTEPFGKAVEKLDYDLLILDEAHYLKTVDSRRTRAVFGGGEGRSFSPIMDRCKRVLALTGTPLPNRPREAYTLARGLDHASIDWMSEDRFSQRFNPSEMREREVTDPDGTPRKVRYVDERTGRHAELQNRLRANFMVRHLK